MHKHIILEDSFQQLYSNTLSKFPTRKRSSARVQVLTTMYIPSVPNKTLECRCKTRTDDESYDTIAYLQDVEYVNQEQENELEQTPTSGATTFQSPDGMEHSINPVSRNNQVEVFCSCLDFYWTYAVWNDAKNSLYGDSPDPYTKKTDKMPRNPQHAPGLCKHLLKFFDTLVKERIIR